MTLITFQTCFSYKCLSLEKPNRTIHMSLELCFLVFLGTYTMARLYSYFFNLHYRIFANFLKKKTKKNKKLLTLRKNSLSIQFYK